MKNNYKWVLLSIILGIVFLFTFLKSPDKISIMLNQVTRDTSFLAMIIHGVYLVLLILGLVFRKLRNSMFSVLLLILSGTASVISVKYFIIPNIIIFVTFFILTVSALIKKVLKLY